MSKSRMRFITWATKDVEDTRKIIYTFKEDGSIQHFTSEDYVSPEIMNKIRYAWIESIELIDNVWNVILYAD